MKYCVVPFQNTVEAWQTVFYISAAIYGVGAILYGLMASGREQKWALEEYSLLSNHDNSNNDQDKHD